MLTAFQRSGKSSPCPICGRTKDSDCRTKRDNDVVFCHSQVDYNPSLESSSGYKYSKRNKEGLWGIWYKPILGKRDRPQVEPIVYYEYPARDGSQHIRVVRQKGGKIEFYQLYFIDGEWISPSEADRRGIRKHLETMRKAVPIYRYQQVREAIANGELVIWVEGEACADALWKIGQPATTSIGGSAAFGSWGNYSKDLEGLNRLLISPDMDKPGVEYARKVELFFKKCGIQDIAWLKPYPEFPHWDNNFLNLPDEQGLDLKDELQEGLEVDVLFERINQSIAHLAKGASDKPDFNETIDRFDEYIADYQNDLERQWEADNFAFDNKLTQRKMSGNKLLALSQARKDGHGELKVFDALDLLDRNVDGRRWLIAGNVPIGTTIVLAASGGQGKTTLLYNFAKCIATGQKWSGFRVMKGRTLVIQTDEPECDIAEKLDISEFHDIPRGSVDFILEWRFTQIRQLRELIEREKYSLIIIDSWTAAHAGTGADLISSSAGDNMYKLRNIAQELNCTFVVVHHFNKLNDLRDSSTINDNCSEVWKLHSWSENDHINRDQRILEISKSRAGLTGKYVLQQTQLDYSWQHCGRQEDAAQPGNPLMVEVIDLLEKNLGTKFSLSQIASYLSCTDLFNLRQVTESIRRTGMCDSEQMLRTLPTGEVVRSRLYFLPADEPLISHHPEDVYAY